MKTELDKIMEWYEINLDQMLLSSIPNGARKSGGGININALVR